MKFNELLNDLLDYPFFSQVRKASKKKDASPETDRCIPSDNEIVPWSLTLYNCKAYLSAVIQPAAVDKEMRQSIKMVFRSEYAKTRCPNRWLQLITASKWTSCASPMGSEFTPTTLSLEGYCSWLRTGICSSVSPDVCLSIRLSDLTTKLLRAITREVFFKMFLKLRWDIVIEYMFL